MGEGEEWVEFARQVVRLYRIADERSDPDH